VDAGLHILKRNLVVGMLADGGKRFSDLCALVVTDHKNTGEFGIDYLTTMTTQTSK